MIRWVFIASLGLALWMAATRWEQRPLEHPPGVLVPEQPVQEAAGNSVFGMDDYILTRRASFRLRARVLSKERYWMGREADLSPLDLALGWSVMSDQSVLDRIEIRQSGRWYYTRYRYPAPVGDGQIVGNSSNMHMIPARRQVERQLQALRTGDIVRLQGYLVDVDHPSGWHWRTSLSRTDTGNGSCELFYVDQVVTETADR